ncbi:hypothetical protein SEVIR_5G266300v4 [Setaria viridis]|uniref:Homeobox domain-containing protein n=1 Tax=Setaria viridis TaxID=4556 RepID=A0A4U6UIC6_SETVI|nr:WUSCHEL-related homeobox 7-like [Setaria viridis]TKW15940.1 hypothetical protein SEVIR_5G266300v2 [Setaria viridis]
MASSFNNRHWPSMFRSKHAAEQWQPQPDISSSPPSSLLSGGGNTTNTGGSCLNKHPSSGYAGGEERTPDPKPRWNPRPEQIRILEAIFNSGMINPPRDEIPRIRMRLQEYGQVGDANVFYWFQNRKSRSKNKLRAAGAARPCPARAPARAAAVTPPPPPAPPQLLTTTQQVQLLASPVPQAAPTSSSSSSSDRSSGSSRPAAKRAAQAMSPTAAMDLLGPLAAACPQMYYQGQPVAPPASAPAHKVHDLVASDEPIFQPWPQGCCLSAAELAAILGGQYMHVPVPVQQQPPAALPAGAFLGLCNEVTEPAITGQRTCTTWGAGLGQYCPGGGAEHHQLGKNTDAAPAREVAHEDATKLGLLQYCFGDSTAVDATAGAATTRDAAVTVATVAATATTARLTGLPASSAAPNGVVANYDLMQLQGLAADGALGAGATTTSTGAPVAVATAAVAGEQQEGAGVAALCITDSVTGRSVAHSVAAARLDVRAQFGEAAVLFRCAGERGLDLEHVPVDASGCTVQPLQHGAFYYVLV